MTCINYALMLLYVVNFSNVQFIKKTKNIFVLYHNTRYTTQNENIIENRNTGSGTLRP